MPRSRIPPNRAAIESELTAEERRVLEVWCELLNIHPHGWHEADAFAAPLIAAAVARLAERLEAAGASRHRAIRTAAARLGVAEESAVAWLRRWPARSREWSQRQASPSVALCPKRSA